MNDSTDSNRDDEPAATCILCGEPLAGREVIKYQGWYCHAECTKTTVKKRIEGFDAKYFWIGFIGTIIGALSQLPLILTAMVWTPENAVGIPIFYYLRYDIDYLGPAYAYVGLSIGFLLMAFGYYGFAKNYTENWAFWGSILSIALSLNLAYISYIIFVNGPDLEFRDPTYHTIMYYAMPDFTLAVVTQSLLAGILLTFTGIVLWMLEKELALGTHGKLISIVLFVSGAALFTIPSTPFGFLLIMAYLFFYSGIPSEWTETEPANIESI